MKKILMGITCIVALFMSSCADESTEGVSRVTNFPVITINGESLQFVEIGETYTDAGAVSMVGETEIETVTTYVDGLYTGSAGVDTSSPDKYFVQYEAVNEDGFSGSALRTVWVVPPTGDLVTGISGLYTCSVQRAPAFTPTAQYNDLEYVAIWETSPGTFQITHAIGGYYDLGRGYGPAYSAGGMEIIANDIPSNDFSSTTAFIPGFGLTVTQLSEIMVNPVDKMVTFTANGAWGNGDFKVQLTQVQL